MRETQIVRQIGHLATRAHRDKALIKGIGDDCAILRPRSREDLVLTSDLVIEDRHFSLKTHSAANIGHKALARSLSDLAAMGSEPVLCLVSLAVPPSLKALWIRRFYEGLLALAEKYHTSLAGGDLARADKVVADVVCCGRVPRGKAILRSGARAGDRIYVTGELGASAHGLTMKRGSTWRHHLRPEPRIRAGIELRRLSVSAALDVSDGLSLDLHRLCLASGVSAELSNALPVARPATLEQALHGGEDYELLFTAAPKTSIPRRIGRLPVTLIGSITSGNAGRIVFAGRPLVIKGFDHFQ